ncbi:MAG TPA: DinB family protein [Chitinophagaceae bacterium]|nr:DinB family protein [Chitinophagaceae bacterium]
MRKIEKPAPGEFPPYANMYLKLVPDDGLLFKHFKHGFNAMRKLVLSLPAEQLLHRYAKNKWTIKEVLVHIIDDERIYAYRALCFARNEKTWLPGFEQDEYVTFSNANNRTLENILSEYKAVRNSTITLYEGLDDTALLREGIANNNKVTVRALGYHIVGHELHHMNIIKEKYLNAGQETKNKVPS